MINKLIPRGLRNNNPGNIRKGVSQWQGTAIIQDDKSFVKFITMAHGIRALYRVLRTYKTRHGLNSVSEIINRWAPTIENDTGSYIRSVEKGMINKDDVWANPGDLDALVRGIIRHENGILVLSMIKNSDIAEGRA